MGAVAWVEIPSDLYLGNSLREGAKRLPLWDPYIGSGYPSVFDGHSSEYSVTRLFLRTFPGEQSRDILIFARILLFTLGTALAVSLLGCNSWVTATVVLGAVLVPYAVSYLDIVFLDIDLLAPWFPVLTLAVLGRHMGMRLGFVLAIAMGCFVATLGFLQSQFVFLACAWIFGVLFLVSQRRWEPLMLSVGVSVGFMLLFPLWLPLIQNLNNFVTSRSVDSCIASQGIGLDTMWRAISQSRSGGSLSFQGGTLAGLCLIAATAPRMRAAPWIAAYAIIFCVQTLGAPALFCDLPGVGGVRLSRHLSPYLQFIFLCLAGLAIQVAISDGFRKWRKWILALGCILSLWASPNGNASGWLIVVALGLAIAADARKSLPANWVARAYLIAFALLVIPPFALSGSYPSRVIGGLPQQLANLPTDAIDPEHPLGAMRELSQKEDRRHFSPDQVLFPNWSSAFRILDLRLLEALYPKGFHRLNGGLFHEWINDPQHKLAPDRFVGPADPRNVFRPDFERVLILNRVSLFSFLGDKLSLPDTGPYASAKCRRLGTDSRVASVVCPAVGGVGYFPSEIHRFETDDEALTFLSSIQDMDRLVGLVVLTSPVANGADLAPAQGRVIEFERGPDWLIYRLEVATPGLFVIADTNFPGWKALVNGLDSPILNVNLAFKGVAVPAGMVEIRLRFEPVT